MNAAIEKATKELDALQAQRVHVPETLEQDLVQIPESIHSLNAQIEQLRKQVQSKYSAVERIESVPRELYSIREMMAVTLSLLEKHHQGADELETLKSTIENRKLTDMTLSSKLEQTERLTRNLEEKSRVLRETMQQKRDQHEEEVASRDQAIAAAQVQLMESRRLLEEKRRKQQEIWQREEKYAQEVTAQMENLKHQFECYSTEIVQALRIN